MGIRFQMHRSKLNPMNNFFRNPFLAAWLLSALGLSIQSCDDSNAQFEKSKVQFELAPGNTSQGRVKAIELPENANLWITIKSSSGTPIFSDHEVQVSKEGGSYIAHPLELQPGTYVVTDFIIAKDNEVLNAAPKGESPFSAFVTHALPYSFTVTESSVAKVSMQVLDARDEKPEAFGYASFKQSAANKLSFIVSNKTGGSASIKEGSGELRRGTHLIKTFSVKPGKNTIIFDGDPDTVYSLSLFAGETAKVKTFNFKELKEELGQKPLQMNLEPALLLTIRSDFEVGTGYAFEFFLDGASGEVNIHWGDGYESDYTLPLSTAHEYPTGTYTAIITGDLDEITNLYGFSYSTVIYGIKGLTNVTALKTYSPSWGAVPIKVDLSNCSELETIFIEKLGGPYETVDLRTDFKLPDEHFIKEFVFYATSLDTTREKITAEELEIFVDNIYENSTRRAIYGGKFFVYPVETPSSAAQLKLDMLQNDYNWDVRLDGNIWDDYSEGARTKPDLDARRENWLRERFPDHAKTLRNANKEFAF